MEGFAGGRAGFQTNELTAKYSRLRILFYPDTVTASDWDTVKNGRDRIIRLIAEKPSAGESSNSR